MATYNSGDRVATASGNLVGTVIEQIGEDVLLEWDDESGPQEDEVHVSLIHSVAA